MGADSDDPALLFAPIASLSIPTRSERSTETPPRTPPSFDASTRRKYAKETRVYVDVPTVDKKTLDKYLRLEDLGLTFELESENVSDVEEIEGEYRLGGKRFLYARHGDQVVRRKEDWEFRNSYPDLYNDYMKRKKRGELPPFDPSSVRIHPKHREKFVISLAKRKPKPSNDDYVSDSESSDEQTDGEADDYSDRPYERRSTRATKRQTTKSVKLLPYSPRMRERKKGRRTITSDEDEDAETESDSHRRRSFRNVEKKSYTFNDDGDYGSSGETEESDDYEITRSRHKGKQPVKRKGPRPAYGRVRNVEDVYDSDPETAVLRAHRDECEKCHRAPAHVLLKRSERKTKRKKKQDDDGLSEDNQEFFKKLGGWVRCLKCCVAMHWYCLTQVQRAEVVKAVRMKAEGEGEKAKDDLRNMKNLDKNAATEFLCGSCSKGGICMVCQEVVVEPERKVEEESSGNIPGKDEGVNANDQSPRISTPGSNNVSIARLESPHELLFRCCTCKRIAHYSHLPVDDDDLTPDEVAKFYQTENKWQCYDCASYVFSLDKIIAWRPSPANAVDAYMTSPEAANYREALPREYLVKWVDRSYRRVQWVPHMWLVARSWAKLKHFYESGPKITLLNAPVDCDSVSTRDHDAGPGLFNTEDEPSRATSVEAGESNFGSPPPPLPDASSRIPLPWKTVDRVLDVLLWAPRKARRSQKKQRLKDVDEEDSTAEASDEARREFDTVLDLGEQPSAEVTETVEEFEKRTGQELGEEHIGRVVWAFIKWDDLPYDESTWDSPPRPGTFGHTDYENAFRTFVRSRAIYVRKRSTAEIKTFENRKNWSPVKLGIAEDGKYDIGQEKTFNLMPFQVDGVNWLSRNWFNQQQCILADEMGLGKTVQIITFLGLLHAKTGACPYLVVVPNSTITNWVREFARWAPSLRVVPFYGEQKSRDIIKKYELQHPVVAPGTTGAKYHVLIATYEAVTNPKDFTAVFKNNTRWEVLIVDEGQRLKSDASLIFRRLKELKTAHRIIMTGTPLNNNIRELFNLMNFLDPEEWIDLETLTREYEELDEERVKDLHERLRPYFLRRVKAEVLDLPAKNEIIVPVSMSQLQKEVYKSVLSKNLDILRSLRGASSTSLNKSAIKTSNLRNMLMQLRKCIQHPYLVADDIEQRDLPPEKIHSKLIDGSGKLRLLKMLLPKLKARGHRVLLFSQFKIALDIIEDFLEGEQYKFKRLDGDTKQAQRQKDMDEFNKEDSDIFIYILTTRAGGVGINLWSADTVIIFDPDFNPHQDLQAIARAHRYGQKKTCLVFKFMTKNSAEEKIVQLGKKKLVLDHLIVQKMDDEEDSNEVQSILTFGAQALFEEDGSESYRDITYSDNDLDALIEKIESEEETQGEAETSNNAFSFAEIWSARKDGLEEVPAEAEEDNGDSWAQTLQKIASEQSRVEAQEASGRGVRRKATMVKTKYFEDVGAESPKKRKRHKFADDDDYNLPQSRGRGQSESPTENSSIELDSKTNANANANGGQPQAHQPPFPVNLPSGYEQPEPARHTDLSCCGLCKTIHGPGGCYMVGNPINLLNYRRQLIYSDEEPYKDRVKAVRAIDEELSKKGNAYLIAGEPTKPVKNASHSASLPRSRNPIEPIPSLPTIPPPVPPMVPMPPMPPSLPVQPHYGWPDRPLNHYQVDTRQPVGLREAMFGSSEERRRDIPSTTSADPVLSLKRSTPPAQDNPTKKKPKLRICEICNKVPYHLPVHCPVVAKGPESILNAISRLTNGHGNPATLTALRSILRKQKEAIASASQHVAMQPVSNPSTSR